jgi:hypothetical protein
VFPQLAHESANRAAAPQASGVPLQSGSRGAPSVYPRLYRSRAEQLAVYPKTSSVNEDDAQSHALPTPYHTMFHKEASS